MGTGELVRIGRIVKAHGIKGAVKVHPYGDSPDSLRADGLFHAVRDGEMQGTLRIAWARPGGRAAVVSFEGVDDRDGAERLAGVELCVDRSRLPELEEGTYYWSDLIGLAVYTREDRYLGRLASVIQTGSNDVYVVDDGERETLVPALEWVVASVDLAGGTMRVDLPEGL